MENLTNIDKKEEHWDARARQAAFNHPLKTIKTLPKMVGITPQTKKRLRWKSFRWMVTQDHERKVLKGFLRHPLRYGWRFLKSLFQKEAFVRDGDFFLYGIESKEVFPSLLSDKNNLFVLGFSYCHKPFECPSGRFTDECIRNEENPVCQQCFIGKALHFAPKKRTIPLLIPTVHYIGGKIFDLIDRYPNKKIVFLITACELTLTMFGDWGNMVGIQGIGVRLDGRICNTMDAFALSERGIKPGLTVVREGTKRQILDWFEENSLNP